MFLDLYFCLLLFGCGCGREVIIAGGLRGGLVLGTKSVEDAETSVLLSLTLSVHLYTDRQRLHNPGKISALWMVRSHLRFYLQ